MLFNQGMFFKLSRTITGFMLLIELNGEFFILFYIKAFKNI